MALSQSIMGLHQDLFQHSTMDALKSYQFLLPQITLWLTSMYMLYINLCTSSNFLKETPRSKGVKSKGMKFKIS